MHVRALLLFAAAVSLANAGCKEALYKVQTHKCEEDGGEVAKELIDEKLVLPGAEACTFGGARQDSVMEHKAYTKVYHPMDFRRAGLDYLDNAEKNGWERVACGGGLGGTELSEHSMTECAKKGDLRVRFHAYDFDGACVDIDLLRLKTKEEVLDEKKKR